VPRTNLGALQGTVFAALAQMLDIELQPEAQQALAARATEHADAFAAYVRGIGLLEGNAPEALDQAIATFERAVEHDPGFALAHARLGTAYLRKYNATREATWVERTEAAVARAVELDSAESQGYVTRATLYTTTGQYDEAVREAHHALELEPASDEAYFALAAAYDANGQADAAEAAYQEAIERKPGYWRGYYRLGLFYRNQGRYEEALQALDPIRTLAPDNARSFNLLGAVYYDLDRLNEARQAFEHAAAIQLDDDPFSNLGTIAWDQGRYADAVEMYRRALALDDHDYRVWGNLANAYEQLPDSQAQAESAYREAIRRAEADRAVNPRDDALLTDLGNYYVALGDTAQAREAVAQAAALDPEDGWTAFYLAVAYERLGEREEALRWIERAFAGGLTPEYVERTPALAALVRDPRYTDLVSRLPGQ
jgi:tetratricopeptide (TPR) repeat protein